jgi:hypothetical protein
MINEFIAIFKELFGTIPNPWFSIPIGIIIIAFIRLLLRVCKRDIDSEEEIHTALAENPGEISKEIDERLSSGKTGYGELAMLGTQLLPPVGISATFQCPYCKNIRHALFKGFGDFETQCAFLQCGETFWIRISIVTVRANPSIPPPRPIPNDRWRS